MSERPKPERLRQWHKVYEVLVPELFKAYGGRTSYATAQQRMREHFRALMELPLLTRGELEARIRCRLVAACGSRAEAMLEEQELIEALRKWRGWEVLNLRDALNPRRAENAEAAKHEERRWAPEPKRGPLTNVLVRRRERARLELERTIVQALMPVGTKRTIKELTTMTTMSRDAINRAIAQSEVIEKTGGAVSLKQEPQLVTSETLRELLARDTRPAQGTEARAELDALDRGPTPEEIAAERARLLRHDDPSRLRTDNTKGKAERLYALIHNATADLQQLHTEPRFPDLASKRFNGDADELRHQVSIWQRELTDGIAMLRANGKTERLREINAYISRAPAVADAATRDGWANVQASLIIDELSGAKGEGVHHGAPELDPDF